MPASESLEQEGTVTNLEGRVQRLRAAATPPPGVPDGYGWTAELGERLGLEVPADAAQAFTELARSRTASPACHGRRWASGPSCPTSPGVLRAGRAAAAAAGGAPQGTTLVAYES